MFANQEKRHFGFDCDCKHAQLLLRLSDSCTCVSVWLCEVQVDVFGQSYGFMCVPGLLGKLEKLDLLLFLEDVGSEARSLI